MEVKCFKLGIVPGPNYHAMLLTTRNRSVAWRTIRGVHAKDFCLFLYSLTLRNLLKCTAEVVTERQMDGQTDRETDRERETDRHMDSS